MSRAVLVLSIALAVVASGCGFALTVDDAPAAQPTTTVPGASGVPGVVVGPTTTIAAVAEPASVTSTVAPVVTMPPPLESGEQPWCGNLRLVYQTGELLPTKTDVEGVAELIYNIQINLDEVDRRAPPEVREVVQELMIGFDDVAKRLEGIEVVEDARGLVDAFIAEKAVPIKRFVDVTVLACTGKVDAYTLAVPVLNG